MNKDLQKIIKFFKEKGINAEITNDDYPKIKITNNKQKELEEDYFKSFEINDYGWDAPDLTEKERDNYKKQGFDLRLKVENINSENLKKVYQYINDFNNFKNYQSLVFIEYYATYGNITTNLNNKFKDKHINILSNLGHYLEKSHE